MHARTQLNVYIHYLVVKRDDVPQRLVIFTHFMGLCFLPLQIVCLDCKYFRFPLN